MNRRYGWRGPGPTDWNAPHYALAAPTTVDHVDRLSIDIPIRDQAAEGCCTGFGTSRAIQIATKGEALSPQFAYFNGRVREAAQDADTGCIISDVLDGINEYGIPRESAYPYISGQFAQRPTLDAYADAMTTPKVKALRVVGLAALRNALTAGHPVVFGFSVPQYFEDADIARTGIMRMPGKGDFMIGGHCVVADGFDSRTPEPFIWCANSWTAGWGINGWFKMPAQWFTDSRRLWDDAHAILPA